MYGFKRLTRLFAVVGVLMAAACGGAPQSSGSVPTPAISADVNSAAPAAPVVVANNAAAPENQPAIQVPVAANGQPLAARVNGVDIARAELDRAVSRLQQQQQQQSAGELSALQASVLETLIQQQLIDQAAAKENIVVTDADILNELNANVQIAGSDAAWQKWLGDNLYSPDEFRATVHDMLVTSRMRDQITQPLTGAMMQVRARHILVATEAEAQGILDRLKSGEDFATLAQQYSKDVTTRDQGGDLGWFTQDELLEPSLAQIAFSSEPGAIAGPIPTTLGYHILQPLEKAERPVPDDKRAMLAQARFENWLQSLYQGAIIERYL